MEKINIGSSSKAVRLFDIGHPEVLERIAREIRFRAENAETGQIITHELADGLVLTFDPKQKSINTIVARVEANKSSAS